MTEAAQKRKPVGLIAAFLAGAGLGGSGYVPHLIVHGDAPESGAECHVVGPALNGQRICVPEAPGWGVPMDEALVVGQAPVVEAPDAGTPDAG